MPDFASAALNVHNAMYTRSRALQASGLASYHPKAAFSDPIVTVRKKGDIAVQFGSFETAFKEVKLEVHGVAEIRTYKWPSYGDKGTEFDVRRENRYVAVDSTQFYTPNAPLSPAIPIRVWTVYQFTAFSTEDPEIAGIGSGAADEVLHEQAKGIKWLITRHEDSWALSESVAAFMPSVIRKGLHGAKDAWSWAFTRALELLTGGGKAAKNAEVAMGDTT